MKALILVDLQKDFMPGGALPVPDGDQIVRTANELSRRFPIVAATQDWHPSDHGSFASNHPGRQIGDVVDLNGLSQILWPVHCVADSPGAQFHKDLDTGAFTRIFHKGTDSDIDSYSALFDNGHRKSTGLSEYLREQGVDEVYICGLATDYCVKYTALDAVAQGFRTFIIEDASRGVNLRRGDVKKALEEMKAAGVVIVHVDEIRSQDESNKRVEMNVNCC